MTTSKSHSSLAKDVVVRRLYARGRWTLNSAAHFGGEDVGVADMCLVRDADGCPFIPAASIAGAARSFLAREILPWSDYKKGSTSESKALRRLFGGAGTNDNMSALMVADVHCRNLKMSIRDGVRVDPESGAAASKAKFDIEVIERGAEFELCFECVIRKGDPSSHMIDLFAALLHGFEVGDIRLGARTRRGYGRGVVASWEMRDLSMCNQDDVIAWLRGDPWGRPPSKLHQGMRSSKRQFFRMVVDFSLRTSLLIRSSSTVPDAPDTVHVQSAGEPVVPGTSFAGAFRQQATLIASTVGWSAATISELFGPIHERRKKANFPPSLWASRVAVEEQLVQAFEVRRQYRVAIDRFTGGSLPHALFDEEPVFPKSSKSGYTYHVQLTLTLEEPEDAEIGLLLLTLRDFWIGHASLGGEAGNGRGTLDGVKARLRLARVASSKAATTQDWKLKRGANGMTVVRGDKKFLEDCVAKVHEFCGSPAGSRRRDDPRKVVTDG